MQICPNWLLRGNLPWTYPPCQQKKGRRIRFPVPPSIRNPLEFGLHLQQPRLLLKSRHLLLDLGSIGGASSVNQGLHRRLNVNQDINRQSRKRGLESVQIELAGRQTLLDSLGETFRNRLAFRIANRQTIQPCLLSRLIQLNDLGGNSRTLVTYSLGCLSHV